VSEITKGLGQSADRAELCTIHSFLYRNVVKPYLHLLKNKSGEPLVNYAEVDGHDEHRPTFSAVKAWLDSVNARLNFYGEHHEIFAYLKTLSWQRNEANDGWVLKPVQWVRPVKYLPTTKLDSYKQFYWREGIIDYDDVLYFAYRILEEYPLVREFLSLRFPYMFIDEFQDTNPIQTQVVRWLAGYHTLVGVIGDLEQSIYGFQGAKPDDFTDFNLPGQIDYVIHDNRRSTESIIRFLNYVRGDGINQKCLRQFAGAPVRVYVGDITVLAPRLNRELPSNENLTILARRNDEASIIRRQSSSQVDDLWDQLARIDPKRCQFLEHVIAAGELAKLNHFSLALTKLLRGIRMSKGFLKEPLKFDKNITALERRGVAVSLLNFILTNYPQLCQSTLLDAYQQISNHLSKTMDGLSLKAVKAGKYLDYADSIDYGTLTDALRLPDETRSARTIHQSKSAEFNNVLVYLRDKAQLYHILNPQKRRSDKEAEEKRITYVALSRARDRLSISIPELSETEEKHIKGLGLEVIRLNPS
jgi:DNA helicase-2/ATP-dependent DNA helicase PcrA